MGSRAQHGILAHHRRITPLMYAAIYAPLVLLGISILYPFYYYLINSVNTQLNAGPAYLLPPDFTLRNYQVIFANNRLLTAFMTSTARTLVGTVLTVFNCALCAFALRKPNLPFRNWYLAIFAIPLFFSGGLIPIYLNFRFLGLLDNFLVYILPNLFSFFYIIIMMTSFNDLPVSLEDSARIDGAGYFRIFLRIYSPHIDAPDRRHRPVRRRRAVELLVRHAVLHPFGQSGDTCRRSCCASSSRAAWAASSRKWRPCKMRGWPTFSIRRACSSRPCWSRSSRS